MNESSVVEYYSVQEGYKCVYCKSENSSHSHAGMWTRTLSPMDYQNLIDRGWRRTGKYCYKPTMHLTCCPQYEIRCEALRFTLSRSQKKVLKNVHKFLTYGEQESTVSAQHSENSDQQMDNIQGIMDMKVLRSRPDKEVNEIPKSDIEITDLGSPCQNKVTDTSSKEEKGYSTSDACNKVSDSSHVDPKTYPLSPIKLKSDGPSQKAKELRQGRKLQKLLNKGVPVQEAMSSVQKRNSEPKTIENFLSEPFPLEPVYKLEHIDGVSSSETSIYGSFHQQYWLNDKLIAVGVIDVLPYCIYSVYFYYDPDYKFLSLGTYAALREIALTRELNKAYPDIQYYCMGFYVHSCVKMRYKEQFHPSYLLCPETYIFQPIEKCKPKLDIDKYHRLEEDLTKEDCDGDVSLQDILVLYNDTQMSYLSYKKANNNTDDEAVVQEYAGFVGKKCYKRMLLYRS